jgi:hypothetical protein
VHPTSSFHGLTSTTASAAISWLARSQTIGTAYSDIDRLRELVGRLEQSEAGED